MFYGWRVVGAAFVIALFAWGIGFYGPPIFLQTLHADRGWAIMTISAAITCHYVLGAAVIAKLAALHRRYGVRAVTRAGAVLTAIGLVGWGSAPTPSALFIATAASGAGWALTSGAALNAIVSPWFARRRPAALSMAYNGASLGGVVFSPLWVALIAAAGLGRATGLVAVATVTTMWVLAGRYLGHEPAALGLLPDGGSRSLQHFAQSESVQSPAPPLPYRGIWGDRRFSTLAAATALSLFAQIGLVAHLFSLLTPALGPAVSGLLIALTTACAILGRTALGGLLLRPGIDRGVAAAANVLVQTVGSAALMLGYGHSPALLVAGCVFFGLGLGNVSSLPALVAQSNFAPEDVPRVVALVTALSQLTFAFAPLSFGALRVWITTNGAIALFAAAMLIQLAAALVYVAGRRPSRLGRTRTATMEASRILQLRPNCECCDRDLPAHSHDALICSYECTFCRNCAETLFGGRCPNCGGELVRRPVRRPDRLQRHPASTERVYKSHPECSPAAI